MWLVPFYTILLIFDLIVDGWLDLLDLDFVDIFTGQFPRILLFM